MSKSRTVQNIALLLSGGMGERLGTEIPKQYLMVDKKMVITYCIERLFKHHRIHAVQIVAAQEWQERIIRCLPIEEAGNKFRGFTAPGKNRQLSIRNALEDIRAYAHDSDYIFIHDAVRPLLTEKIISEYLNAAYGHGGVLPVLPMTDTVYVSTDGSTVSSLLNRQEIYAGQAPEVFRYGEYYEANKRLALEQMLMIHGSAEPAIMAGMDIVMINGDERNFKITTKADLQRFREMAES